MKRINNLYNEICSIENLIIADKKARIGKSKSDEIKSFDANRDALLKKLNDDLVKLKYKTSEYETFIVNEYGKDRKIYKLPYYPDRIVHHAIMNVLEPIWCNIFIRNTFACIKNRGIHDGLKRIKDDLYNDVENTKYCLKLDIKKYYPSIDHDILKKIIRYKIKDNNLLCVLDEIIDSSDGVPIGNYLSQYFANLYLTYFDHWIKEVKNIKYYYRYADDIVVFDSSKDNLHLLFCDIENYLNTNLKLIIKQNHQVFDVDIRGIDFLGYVIRHDYILLRKTIKNRLFRKIYKSNANKITKSISAYNGWLKYCNSYNLKNKIIYTMAKKFSDLGIIINKDLFSGEKISITKIINKDILVKSYKLSESKFSSNQCLTIQINVDGQDRIVFTGSKNLISQIEQINKDDFPIETKIEIINKNGYIFS